MAPRDRIPPDVHRMTDVHKVTVQVGAPRGTFPNRVEIGCHLCGYRSRGRGSSSILPAHPRRPFGIVGRVTLTRDIARGNLSWAVMRSWQYPFLIIVCFEITALPASGGGLLARPVCQCSPLSAAHGKTGGPALQCGPAGFHVPQRDGIVLGQVRSGHDSWSSRNPSAVDPIEFVIVF